MRTRRPRVRRRGRALAAALLCALAGCGAEADADAPGLVLGPGDSLLSHLDRGRVVRAPASTWPADVAGVLGREDRALVLPLSRAGWRDAGAVPEALGALAGLAGTPRLWRHREAAAVSLSFAGARVRLDGRSCTPVTQTPGGVLPDDLLAWSGGDDSVLFADSRHRELMAIAPQAPADIVVRFAADPWPDARRWEPDPRPGVGDDAAALSCRAELGRVSRRALLLPGRGVLQFPVATLRAEALAVAVGLPAHGYRVEAGGLIPDRAAGDGVVCAIEAVASDGTTRRLWAQALKPGEGWVEATVPLDVGDDLVALRLVTEPGAAGDAAFDHALFAGLQLVGSARRADPRPHIVLLDLDTLRADRLGCYGAPRDTSPRIDAWAAEQAVLFEDCMASSSWTLPSTATLLTGLLPYQHGVDRPSLRLSPQHQPLAQRLADAGYETWGVAEGGYVSASFGFDLGFDTFETRRSQEPDWDAVLDRLAVRNSERPLFLLLHTYLAHAPYEPDPRWVDPAYAGPLAGAEVDADNVFAPHRLGQLELDPADGAYVAALYDAGVARLDAVVGAFLERLDEVLPPAHTLVVITSDHGEELLDHGGLDHGLTLYDEVLRVPLIVRFPGRRSARETAPVSLADVVPTVLDVVGLPRSSGLSGRSLRAGVPAQRVRIAELAARERAVRYEGFKLVDPVDGRAARLYDLDADPGERVDRSGQQADRVADLRARWTRLVGDHVAPADAARDAAVDDTTRESLQQLGYVGDGGR